MLKKAYHPKAFLAFRRNIRPGLITRTKIISILEEKIIDAKTLAEESRLNYSTVLYHLHLLIAEGIVVRKGKKPFIWGLTGVGQQRLPIF